MVQGVSTLCHDSTEAAKTSLLSGVIRQLSTVAQRILNNKSILIRYHGDGRD